MTLTYIAEAVDNYNALFGQEVDNNTAPFNCIPTQLFAGLSYNPARRKIMYVAYVCVNATVTNTTGFDLWNGADSILKNASYDARSGKNLYVCEVDIDTREVTWFECWSPTSVVPASVFGDGTAHRYTDTGTQNQGPTIADPRTGNIWVHAFGDSIVCSIYLFRIEDSFQQVISPLGNPGLHMTVRGMEADWVYVTEEQFGVGNLTLTPREITAAETTADYLLPYASYTLPSAFDHSYNAAIIDENGDMWWFSCKQAGTRDYTLTKFSKPSPFVYPTPPADGGFTDETPWGSGTGPNTDVSAYTNQTTQPGPNQECYAFRLPATNEVALLSLLLPDNTGDGITDPALWRLDCTYVNLGTLAFDFHQAFVTGYMTANWQPTSDPSQAAWSPKSFLQTNAYLDFHDQVVAGENYSLRRLYFSCRPVVDGVVDPSPGASRFVLVTYRFVSGAAPVVISAYAEDGWDEAYPAFQERTGEDNPIFFSIPRPQDTFEIWSDIGLYDAVTNSWWTSSYDGFDIYQLDTKFIPRASFSGFASPPFLRLSFGGFEPPPTPEGPPINQFCNVFPRIGAPQGRQRFKGATPPSKPVNTVAPLLGGTAVEGNTLAVSTGSWTGFPAGFAYQWNRDGSPIVGETENIYLLTVGDVGASITCTVTAHNAAGSTDAESNAVVPISQAAPTNVTPPAITGNLTVGSTLTGSHGTWDQGIDSYSVKWKRAGVAITGAEGFTYVTVGDDVGQDITFYVEATNTHGTGNATSSAVVPTSAPSGIPIANAAALTAMFAAGVGTSGGKTYDLAGVSFGAFSVSNADFSSDPIIILGQGGTTFTSLTLSAVKGVTWGGFNVSDAAAGTGVTVGNGSSHITFSLVTSNAPSISGNGFAIDSSSFITINGAADASAPDINNRGTGVVITDSSDITLAGLTLTNLGPDGILLAGASTVVINACLGYDWTYSPGDHPDFIQGFSSFHSGNGNTGVTITNCGWLRQTGDPAQGYFFEFTSNLVISGCYVYGGFFNAISQSGGATTTVTDCFAQGFPDYSSNIIGRDGTVNMSVGTSYTAVLSNYAGGGLNPGFSPASGFGSNTQISNASPGDFTDLDAWLLTHPNTRARPA